MSDASRDDMAADPDQCGRLGEDLRRHGCFVTIVISLIWVTFGPRFSWRVARQA
jgi:hypothetical protein